MKEKLNVYPDRIKDGNTDEIAHELESSFMDVHENEMRFKDPIFIEGEAYVTDDWLIVSLSIQTQVQLICSVCNTDFSFDIDIQNMMHEEPLENIRDGSFDILPVVRDNILLAVPFYPQCGITTCLRRAEIEPYLKKETPKEDEIQEHGHNPFKDLL